MFCNVWTGSDVCIMMGGVPVKVLKTVAFGQVIQENIEG